MKGRVTARTRAKNEQGRRVRERQRTEGRGKWNNEKRGGWYKFLFQRKEKDAQPYLRLWKSSFREKGMRHREVGGNGSGRSLPYYSLVFTRTHLSLFASHFECLWSTLFFSPLSTTCFSESDRLLLQNLVLQVPASGSGSGSGAAQQTTWNLLATTTNSNILTRT